jgi:transcriptional regulator with XRE-family HTH domain
LQIRKALGLSQREMAERLNKGINRNHVSKFERDKSEPTLAELLAYARIAGVVLEQLIDDDVELTLDL